MLHDLLEHALLLYATLPSHPGKGRIALALTRRFPSLSEFQGTVVRNGFRLQLDCSTQNVSDLILAYAGRYEVRDIRFMLEMLRPGDCMLDVGANIGYYALVAGRAVGESGTVHAFEPFPAMCSRLATHVRLNQMPWVVCNECAVSDRTGTSRAVETPNKEASHLAFENEAIDGAISVETTTIDTYVADHVDRPVSLIKCDAEGYDLAVLRGAACTIQRDRPAIIVEVHRDQLARNNVAPGAITDLLREWGYRCYKGNLIGRSEVTDQLPDERFVNLLAMHRDDSRCR